MSDVGLPRSPIQNILDTLDNKTFTVWVGKFSSTGPGQGLITFGGFDKEHCSPSVTYVPLIQQDTDYRCYSQIDAFAFDTYFKKVDSRVYFDTGFSILALPSESYRAVENVIQPS